MLWKTENENNGCEKNSQTKKFDGGRRMIQGAAYYKFDIYAEDTITDFLEEN